MDPSSGVKRPSSDLRNTVLPDPLCPMIRFVFPFQKPWRFPLICENLQKIYVHFLQLSLS